MLNPRPNYKTIVDFIGNTPLVKLQRLINDENNNTILLKLEGNNPAGSVKDRPALNMINQAELNNDIQIGDRLIEATSGNTGIALAMVAAIKGYKITLIMPDNMSLERRGSMAAYGAELILVPEKGGMEAAIDKSKELEKSGYGKILGQFSNPENPSSHYYGTGPEIWQETEGQVTHFISAMGTTGTIMGVSKYLKEQNSDIKVIGVQPDDSSNIPGIRKWPEEYLPKIYQANRIDEILEINQSLAEQTTLDLAKQEGIFCGVSSGGAVAAALQVSAVVKNATIVSIICDRGDRYLSTDLFTRDL